MNPSGFIGFESLRIHLLADLQDLLLQRSLLSLDVLVELPVSDRESVTVRERE